jgi:hypothetical protein
LVKNAINNNNNFRKLRDVKRNKSGPGESGNRRKIPPASAGDSRQNVDSKRIHCSLCPRSYTLQRSLGRHMRSRHPDAAKTTSSPCARASEHLGHPEPRESPASVKSEPEDEHHPEGPGYPGPSGQDLPLKAAESKSGANKRRLSQPEEPAPKRWSAGQLTASPGSEPEVGRSEVGWVQATPETAKDPEITSGVRVKTEPDGQLWATGSGKMPVVVVAKLTKKEIGRAAFPETLSESYRCPKCASHFPSISKMMKHWKAEHKEIY